jgi:hypothetical protein
MKTITQSTFAALFVLLLSFAAFSQAPSIKTVPVDAHFHSEDDGFNIDLPAKMVQRKNINENGVKARAYLWEFSDAAVVVSVEMRAKSATTEAEVAASIAEYKAARLKGDKILSESPASIGEYDGVTFVTEKDGAKNLIIYLVYEKIAVILIGSSESKNTEVQKMIAEAIKSFEFVND